jgi:hypothetical protein
MSCVPDKPQDAAARRTVVVVRRMKIAAVAGVAVASAVISARTGTSALLMRREAYYRLTCASVRECPLNYGAGRGRRRRLYGGSAVALTVGSHPAI